MLFSSFTFLFYFLPIFFAAYALTRGHNLTLLFFSLVFYAWGEPKLVLLLLVLIAFNHMMALKVDHAADDRSKARLLALGIAVDLVVLAAFKYLDLLITTLNELLPQSANLPLVHLPLPLGISFFTFHVISYLIDVRRGEYRAEQDPVKVGLYITLFPQLIAGPIVRFWQVKDALAQRTTTSDGLIEGTERFVIGFAKKVLVADTLAVPVDAIFALHESLLTAPVVLYAVLLFTLQIYYDFSGYSDMAIGLARILGFRFPENFDHPYAARSLRQFWRRWHISLSSWFRDYLYKPLGGDRGGSLSTARNLWIIFLLCGLWHGASWTFVAWGAWHGLFLVLERTAFGKFIDDAPRPVGVLYALSVVMVGWLLFRATGFAQAATHARILLTPDAWSAVWPVYVPTDPFVLAMAILGTIFSFPIRRQVELRLEVMADAGGLVTAASYSVLRSVSYLLVFLLALGAMSAVQNTSFIYFRF